jgi:hypothetical protein
MQHHGVEHFELILVEYLGDVSRSEANKREQFWISEYNSVIPNGYNMTRGGDGGNTLEFWSEADKRSLWSQQANKRVGQKRSEETCKRLSEIARGRVITEETRKKISNTNKEKGITPPDYTKWVKGQVGTFTGNSHTEKSKEKMAVAKQGKTYDELWGEEKANEERLKRKLNWTGSKNPNFVKFDNSAKIKILEELSKSKIKISIISTMFEISEYKIRSWFRELGIDNYQQLGYNLTNEQWCEFWREKCGLN